MSGEAKIIVTGTWTWDGDGTSSDPADIEAYNAAMEALVDEVRAVTAYVDGVTCIDVEATG